MAQAETDVRMVCRRCGARVDEMVGSVPPGGMAANMPCGHKAGIEMGCRASISGRCLQLTQGFEMCAEGNCELAGADVAYVIPKVMFEAVCTCGWKQLHGLIDNAKFDADRHQREWHGTEET